MKKITNTENTPRTDFLFGAHPIGIEVQESVGQRELIESSQLPTKVNNPSDVGSQQTYTAMGIDVIGFSKGDELFQDVVLPEGWSKSGTGHSMWSYLLDNKGRKRASIFYKAAFYDRDAFASCNCRYSVDTFFFLPPDELKKLNLNHKLITDRYKEYGHTNHYAQVKDVDGTVIFETSKSKYTIPYPLVVDHDQWKPGDQDKHYGWWRAYEAFMESIKQECVDFLNTNYPEWQNVHAYWD